MKIWYKCINTGGLKGNNATKKESRWNKLTDNNNAGVTSNGNILNTYTDATQLTSATFGWFLNHATSKASNTFSTPSVETIWANTKRIQFFIGDQTVKANNTLKILIAIGIKNNIDRFYSIPRAYSATHIFKALNLDGDPYNSGKIG